MRRYILSPAAERDIESILAWTDEHFGEQARLRYEALVVQSILDVAEDPERPGTGNRGEIAPAARTYHLWHARNRVELPQGRVKQPRHFLVFRLRADGQVEVVRVLHDSMDLERHLPSEYRAGFAEGDDP